MKIFYGFILVVVVFTSCSMLESESGLSGGGGSFEEVYTAKYELKNDSTIIIQPLSWTCSEGVPVLDTDMSRTQKIKVGSGSLLIEASPYGYGYGCENAVYSAIGNDGVIGDWEFLNYEAKASANDDCDEKRNYYYKKNGVVSYEQTIVITDSLFVQTEAVETNCYAGMFNFKADEAEKATSCNAWQDKNLFTGSIEYYSVEYTDNKLYQTRRHVLENYDCSYTYVRGEGITQEKACSAEYLEFTNCMRGFYTREQELMEDM